MKNYVFGLSHYAKPTPKNLRKLGDSMLAISTFLAGFTMVEGWNKWIAVAVLFTGVAGKFLTNFFTDKPAEPVSPPASQNTENNE